MTRGPHLMPAKVLKGASIPLRHISFSARVWNSSKEKVHLMVPIIFEIVDCCRRSGLTHFPSHCVTTRTIYNIHTIIHIHTYFIFPSVSFFCFIFILLPFLSPFSFSRCTSFTIWYRVLGGYPCKEGWRVMLYLRA